MKHGRCKAFYTGCNSTCCQCIQSHYNLYKEWCQANNIPENHHAIPPQLLSEKKAESKLKGQTTLDGKFAKGTGQAWTFSRDDVLKSVAELVVCDDQVSQ